MTEQHKPEGGDSAPNVPAPVTTPVRAGGLLRRLSVCAGTPRGTPSRAADDFKALVGLGTPAADAAAVLPGERARKRPRGSVGLGTPVAPPGTADAVLGAADWRLLDSVAVAVAGTDPARALAWLGGDADEAAARAAGDPVCTGEKEDKEEEEGMAALLRCARYYGAECTAGAGEAARALAAQLRLGTAPYAYLAADTFVVLLRAHSIHAAPAAAARRFLRAVVSAEEEEGKEETTPTAAPTAAPTTDERLAEATGLRATTIAAMRSLQDAAGGLVSVAFPRTPRRQPPSSSSSDDSSSGGEGTAQCTTLRGAAWAARVLAAAAGGAAGRATLLAPVPFVHGTLRLPDVRAGTTLRLAGSSAETVATVTLRHGFLPAPLVRTRVLPLLRARIARAAPGSTVTVQLRPSPLTPALGDIRDGDT